MKRQRVRRDRQGFILVELIVVLAVIQVLILLLGSTLTGSASGALLLEGTIFLTIIGVVASVAVPAALTYFFMKLVDYGLASGNYLYKAMGVTGLIAFACGLLASAYAVSQIVYQSAHLPPLEGIFAFLAVFGVTVGLMEAGRESEPELVPVRSGKL